ncbi:MAG: HDIG domain-containing protein [Treponema sp.]|nr:HDIG domain-containing protein [Treponema sp.]
MNKNQSNSEENANIISMVAYFFKTKWSYVLLFLLFFMAAIAIVYFDTMKSDTVASFKLDEFEIGQVADRNIIAPNSIPPDEFYPFAIEEGEKVVKKGFPISEESYHKLEKMAQSHGYVDYRMFANKMLFLLLVIVLWSILFHPSLLGRTVQMKELILETILYSLILFVTVISDKSLMFQNEFRICAVIPSALCSFLIAILFGQRSAMFFAIVSSLGVLCVCDFSVVPSLFTLANSISATKIVRKIERRTDMVFSSIFLSVFNIVFIIMLKVIFKGSFSDTIFLLPAVFLNGFFSGILTLGLLTPLEIIMNTASVFRLMDLSDQNNPTMQQLLISASGTYQHSMMVAQLAENGCKAIGANSLLARVGAYYHDIGKVEHPEYFTENQDGKNKHDDINPSLSASVIRSHVKLGIEKAKALHLPQQIIDIISEHHGNSVIAGFYYKAKEKDPNVSEEDFSYPGNPPITKESAVVMLADTVEAACKSLDKPSVPRLEKFIQELINAKVEHHQLDNSGLTFEELSKIKDIFVQLLAAYYHSRVKYPNQKDPDEIEDKKSIEFKNEKTSDETESSEINQKQSEKSETSKEENNFKNDDEVKSENQDSQEEKNDEK